MWLVMPLALSGFDTCFWFAIRFRSAIDSRVSPMVSQRVVLADQCAWWGVVKCPNDTDPEWIVTGLSGGEARDQRSSGNHWPLWRVNVMWQCAGTRSLIRLIRGQSVGVSEPRDFQFSLFSLLDTLLITLFITIKYHDCIGYKTQVII